MRLHEPVGEFLVRRLAGAHRQGRAARGQILRHQGGTGGYQAGAARRAGPADPALRLHEPVGEFLVRRLAGAQPARDLAPVTEAAALQFGTKAVPEDIKQALLDEQARLIPLFDALRAARALARTLGLFRSTRT
jgi:cysteine synthase